MRINHTKLLCLLVGWSIWLTGACTSTPPPASAPQSIEEMENQPQSQVVQVRSDKMGRDIPATVVVPEQYYDPDLQEEQFPVVYLLHGATGSHQDWPTKADLDDIASEYGIIIVCPDGQDSWYLDSPIDPKMQFETFISQELVNWIDHNYRSIADRRYRAITGLSMGGHGALWNAWRHPDVFGACGSMSGGLDITKFPDKWQVDKRLGKFAENQQRWTEHSVASLVPTLKAGQLAIIIDDGTDDIFYKVNCDLHESLLKRNIGHDFTIRPGNHSWGYWVNSLDYHILFFVKYFANN